MPGGRPQNASKCKRLLLPARPAAMAAAVMDGLAAALRLPAVFRRRDVTNRCEMQTAQAPNH